MSPTLAVTTEVVEICDHRCLATVLYDVDPVVEGRVRCGNAPVVSELPTLVRV